MLMPIKTGACPSGWTEDDTFTGLMMLATTTGAGDVGTTGGTTSFTPAGAVSTPTFSGASDTTSSNSAGTPAGTNSGGAFSEGAISWPAGVPTNASGAFAEGAISWPAGVPALTMASYTPQGTNGASATSGNCAATAIAAGTGSLNACKTTAPNLTVTAQTFTGTAHVLTGTIAWPAGVPTIAAGTFTQPTISWPAGVPTIAAGSFTQPTFAGSVLAGHTHTVTPTGTVSTPTFSGTPATITIPFIKVIWCSKN